MKADDPDAPGPDAPEPDALEPDDADLDDDRLTGPERRCFVTGDRLNKAGLIRFVTGPGGVVFPDLANSLPGRGYYLKADRNVITKAVEKRMFGRGAKTSVSVPDGLVEMIESGLHRRCLDLVGLANRSGKAVSGYEKVRRAISDGGIVLLFTASDAGAEGIRRARSLVSANPAMEEIKIFDATALGAMFSRDFVVHVAVSSGGLAKRLRRDVARLAGMSGAASGDGSG